MNSRKFLVFFVCLVLFAGLIAACVQVERPENVDERDEPRPVRRMVPRAPAVPPAEPGARRIIPPAEMEPRPAVPEVDPDPRPIRVDNQRYSERARRIADRVADLKEAETATCIIDRNTAMIGVQFKDQYKGRMTDVVKRRIEDTAMAADRRIRRVMVTSDPDMIARIEDIFKNIGRGRPLSGLKREIDEIFNRIQPL